MSNARHAGLTPHLIRHLQEGSGILLLSKPAEIDYREAAQHVLNVFPEAQMVSTQRVTEGTKTPHVYGKSLLEQHYDLHMTPSDSKVLAFLRQEVKERGLPVHPDVLLQWWRDQGKIGPALMEQHGIDTIKAGLINGAFRHLDQEIEQNFMASGSVCFTGLLSLPPALGLKGGETVMTLHSAATPLSPRAHLLLRRSTRKRLIILSDQPEYPNWNLRLPQSES